MLQSMGSQRVGHDWATKQQQKNSLKKSMKQIIGQVFKSFFFFNLNFLIKSLFTESQDVT